MDKVLKFRNVVVLQQVPLSLNADSIFALNYKDELLNVLMDEIVTEFEAKNIECFKRRNNIIATEEGYYLAFYEEDTASLALFPDATRVILTK